VFKIIIHLLGLHPIASKGNTTGGKQQDGSMLCLLHSCKTPGQVTPQHNTIILAKLSRCMDGIIRKATKIDLHPNNINTTDGFFLRRSGKPLIRNLKERKHALNNMMPPVGPEKDRFFSYFTSNTAPLSVICLKAPYWSGSFFPYSLSLIGPFPSAFLPQTLYKPSTFQLCHFRPEDGDSMFLRNVGIDLRNHTAPKPKTTPTSLVTAVRTSNVRDLM